MADILERLGVKGSVVAPWLATACNILLLFAVYAVARIEFLLENYQYFADSVKEGNLLSIFVAGARFDTPGIFYTNALYIFLMLLPLHWKECPSYYQVCKWLFIIVNSLALIMNVADSVYFPYTVKRTTWDAVSEFSHENNMLGVIGIEALRHWYLIIFIIIVIFGLWKLYCSPGTKVAKRSLKCYYVCSFGGLAFAACVVVGGIRGGWINHWYLYLLAIIPAFAATRLYKRRRSVSILLGVIALAMVVVAPIGGWRHRDIRPISLSNANAYAKRPVETSLILNTPFALVRTMGSQAFVNPGYFANEAEAGKYFSPERLVAGSDSALLKDRNVVVIIMESFGEEYIGTLNKPVLGERSNSYAPFLDSLANVSTRWRHTFDNASKSIDAMPSILASIPKLGKPFVLTSSAMEPIAGLPALLRAEGYNTAFFHGARTGSMGFDGFARLIGFSNYFGREDYAADSRFGGDKDFDGYWAIWDEPFMQYYALKMNDMKQPFMTALFTASSHHPFRVPEKYEGKFPKGTLPIHATIGYTDMALRKFFETAKKQPWYENTLFVITNDHTNARAFDEYRSDIGAFHGPLLIFDPSGQLNPGVRDGIAQQIDVMPTVLALLGYDKPFVAYGDNLLSMPEGGGRAVSFINNLYQWVEGEYVLQFDGQKSVGLYHIDDFLMARNLLSTSQGKPKATDMEQKLKALIQTYMTRKGR